MHEYPARPRRTDPIPFSDGDPANWPDPNPNLCVLQGPEAPAVNWKRRLAINAFPPGYELFTTFGKGGRRDSYLYGHPDGAFRSILEFKPHLAWLLSSTRKTKPCTCVVCLGRARHIPSLKRNKRIVPPSFTDEELTSLRHKDVVPWSWFAGHRIGDIAWAPVERLPGVWGEEDLSRKVKYWLVKVVGISERGTEDDEEELRLEQERRELQADRDEEKKEKERRRQAKKVAKEAEVARKRKERQDAKHVVWRKPWPNPDNVVVEVVKEYADGKRIGLRPSSSPSKHKVETGKAKDENRDQRVLEIADSHTHTNALPIAMSSTLHSPLLATNVNCSDSSLRDSLSRGFHAHGARIDCEHDADVGNNGFRLTPSEATAIKVGEADNCYTDGNPFAPELSPMVPDDDDSDDRYYASRDVSADGTGSDSESRQGKYSLRRKPRTNFTFFFPPSFPLPSAPTSVGTPSSTNASTPYNDILDPRADVPSTSSRDRPVASVALTPTPSPSTSITTMVSSSSSFSSFVSVSPPIPRSRSKTIYIVRPLPTLRNGSSSPSPTDLNIPLYEYLLPECANIEPVARTPPFFDRPYRIPASVLFPYLARELHVEDHVLCVRAGLEAAEASGQWATPSVDVDEMERAIRKEAGAHALRKKISDNDVHGGEDMSTEERGRSNEPETKQQLTIEYARLRLGTEEVRCGDIVALRGDMMQGRIDGGDQSCEDDDQEDYAADRRVSITHRRRWSTRVRSGMIVVERVVREGIEAKEFLKASRGDNSAKSGAVVREETWDRDLDSDVDSDYESEKVQLRKNGARRRDKAARGKVVIEGKMVFQVNMKHNEKNAHLEKNDGDDDIGLDGLHFLVTDRTHRVAVTDVRGRVRPQFLKCRTDTDADAGFLWVRGMPVVAEAAEQKGTHDDGVTKITVLRVPVPRVHMKRTRSPHQTFVEVLIEVPRKKFKYSANNSR